MEANKWVKSTRSGNNGNCWEIYNTGDEVRVRDSKHPTGPILIFTQAEWKAFVDGVKAGEFD